jgi:flagellar protein FlgJ
MSGEQIREFYKFATIATAGTNLFPATLVTQLLLESGPNLSGLARRANNYFGIKSGTSWTGPVISMTTAEFLNGRRQIFSGTNKVYNTRAEAIQAGAEPQTLFRFYPTMTDGFRGWVEFLQRNPRYTAAGVFSARDPLEQFAALARAGYATDPRYLAKLTAVYTRAKQFFFWRQP